MSFSRAFSSLGCPHATLDEALSIAAKFGLDGVELRTLGGSVDLPTYFSQQFGTPAALAEKLRSSPVRIVSLDTSLHLMGGTHEERTQVLAFVPWAEALGVKWLRVFDGGKGGTSEIAEAVETLAWWQGLRRERGWAVDWMIETHDSLFTSVAIRELLRQAPGTSILWDAHHTWRRGNENPVQTWQEIERHVVHVHVKDSISVPSARHPFTYVLPGSGEFAAKPLIERLRVDDFNGPVSLEWELMWHPYLPPLPSALQAMRDHAWW